MKRRLLKVLTGVSLFLCGTAMAVQVISKQRPLSNTMDVAKIGDFQFDQANGALDGIPARLRQIDGKRVTVVGFVYAPYNASLQQIGRYQIVGPELFKSYQPHPPLVQQRVFATTTSSEAGRRANMVMYDETGLVDASGIFHVSIDRVHGQVVGLFHLDVDEARPHANASP